MASFPQIQLALDFIDLPRALKIAAEAAPYVDRLEAGTPLIKSEGLESVRQLKKQFPEKIIVADMKVMDAGRIEVESAFKAGAQVVHVLGVASDATLRECVEAAQNYGGQIILDLMELHDPVCRAREAEALGVHALCVHTPIDEQMQGKSPFETLRKIVAAVSIPVAVAGGLNSETAAEAAAAGADILIVGGAIIKSPDAAESARLIRTAAHQRKAIRSLLYKRVQEKDIERALSVVSTANLSDAMHRRGDLKGIRPVCPGATAFGSAVTVRTAPGDWAKTVEAIEIARAGQIIVIDAGGVGPAVWGELATHSAAAKKIAGVVIYGGIRDTPEIKRLGFPAYAAVITPTAGEPKGFGEIGCPLKIEGVHIHPGDWVVADGDGVVVLPREKAAEIANRAMDVLERENRLRKEIQQGKTLSEVAYLKKWEKVS